LSRSGRRRRRTLLSSSLPIQLSLPGEPLQRPHPPPTYRLRERLQDMFSYRAIWRRHGSITRSCFIARHRTGHVTALHGVPFCIMNECFIQKLVRQSIGASALAIFAR
jgi:hypothetical protein